jgi:hypothetical protein
MRALLRSERGAIMVMALFMAIFATGCLHYLAGIAAAIAQRERMQDAADAAAFSAAVLHARGMNVIALINMTMAALLAVLISLRLVQLVSIAGNALSIALAFITSGASLGAVPVFTNVGMLAEEGYEVAQPVVQTTLRALRIAARAVRIAIPWVAQARTVTTVVGHYRPPVTIGFSVPGRLTLPTRDGTYDDLCNKAGEYVSDLVNIGTGFIPTPGFTIGDLTRGLIDTGSSWFCETDGAEPPGISTKREARLPVLPKAEACEAYARSERPDIDQHHRLCAEAELETLAADAAINPRTGECVEGPGGSCGPEGLYEIRATRALSACAPRAANQEWKMGLFWWQQHRFTRRYVWEDNKWYVVEPTVPGSEQLTFMKSTARPCGTTSSSIGEEWSTERLRNGVRLPICSNIVPPSDPPPYGQNEVEVVHYQVFEVFRCREIVYERQVLDSGGGDLSPSGDDSDMAPQLIANGAVLGEEDFQIRALVVGELPRTSPAAMLSHLRSTEANENQDEMDTWWLARQLARLGVAQAEFYFDEAGADPAAYLWAMHWTARLRRFHLSDGEPQERSSDDERDASANDVAEVAGTIEAACEVALTVAVAVGALSRGDFSCDQIDLEAFADIVAH